MKDASRYRDRRDWLRKNPDMIEAFLGPRQCPYWKDRYCVCKSEVFKLLPDSASSIGSACSVFPGDGEAKDVGNCKWRKLATGELVPSDTALHHEARSQA